MRWLANALSAALVLGTAAALVPAPAGAVSTADAEYAAALRLKPRPDHGAQLFELCAACHGQDGAGSSDGAVPAIAGQYVPVLVKQLVDFHYDTRHDIRVQGFISHHQLTPQDLADVAAYVSSLPPRQPTLRQESSHIGRGAELFGSLCAGCHGSRAEGDSRASVPRLAGQHSEYLIEQLRDAAEGGRPGMQRDHAGVLAKLSIDDIDDLVEYLSGVAPTPKTP
jgi:cytochrome c553